MTDNTPDLFEAAFELLIGHEGGYVLDPADPGGETKYGISKRAHPELIIADITLDEARSIYRLEYWEPARCGLFAWPMAFALFDAAVHMGVARAVSLLRTALGEPPGYSMGPQVLASVRQRSSDPDLIALFMAERAFYLGSRAHFPTYGRGWMRRLFRVQVQAAQGVTA